MLCEMLKYVKIWLMCVKTLDDITYETPEYEGSEKEWHDIIG